MNPLLILNPPSLARGLPHRVLRTRLNQIPDGIWVSKFLVEFDHAMCVSSGKRIIHVVGDMEKISGFGNRANISIFGAQPYRDVCKFRINSLLEYEKTLNLDHILTWITFFERINKLKEQTVHFIKSAKELGKTIMGYGASTKGNTTLQFFGLDNTIISAIADRSPYKHGLRTVGTDIPIISEEEMRKNQPDYLLILPFHFIKEFKERESEYLKKGGKFIVISPKFEIITG